jgi:hypothetical protein
MDRRHPNRENVANKSPKEPGGWQDELFFLRDDYPLMDDRRASLIRPVDLAGLVPNTAVSVYRDQPSFAHIKLEYLSVNQVFEFWTNILQYQTMHGIQLRPTTMISKDARLTIMSKGRIRTDVEFFQLSDQHLRLYIQHAIRPTDKVMFSRKLRGSLQFFPKELKEFTLSIENFQEFYDRLISYRQEFFDKYEFLAYKNEVNVPKLDNKKFGLIRTFLAKLPQVYAKAAFNQLPKSKFVDLNEFLDLFCNQAYQHYRDSIVAKRLSTFLSGNSKNAHENVEDSDSDDSTDSLHIDSSSNVSDNRRLPIRPPPDPPPINGGRY